jgi:hypothetical protein
MRPSKAIFFRGALPIHEFEVFVKGAPAVTNRKVCDRYKAIS